jgi:hypothetical protein
VDPVDHHRVHIAASQAGPVEDQGRQAKDTNDVDDGQQCAEAAASP